MRLSVINNRLCRGLAGLALSFLIFTGCATTGPKEAATSPAEGQEETALEKAPQTEVTAINVVGEGDRVLIEANGTVRYTAFMLMDPPRLIIDMPDVNLSKMLKPIVVENEFIKDIRIATYGGTERISRIILELREGVEHDVRSGEDSILITFTREGLEDSSVTETEDPTTMMASTARDLPVSDKGPTETPARTEDAAEEPAAPAKNVTDAVFTHNDDTLVLQIFADGRIGNYNTFELDDPPRVVIDIWGVSNATGRDAVYVDDTYVRGVRIGTHPDKVRFVVDAAGDTLPPYTVTRNASYVVATFNASAEEAPVEDAESKAAEPPAMAEAPAAEEVVQAVGPAAEATPEEPAVGQPEEAAGEEAAAEEAPVEETQTREAPAVEEAANETVEEPSTEEAPVEEVAATEAVAAGTNIRNIEFKSVAGKGYLMIEADARPEYTVKVSKDAKTIVVDINDAVIEKELERTLDATRLETPVAMISSYQSSTRPPKVRVLVELRDRARYDVREINNSLNLVFAPAAVKGARKAEKAPKGAKYTGKRIDLDMVDAKVTDVLRLLAEVSNLNIIASDDVKGTITFRLKNVPWDQAFDIILKAKGLDKVREGNVVRVAPASKISQEREAALAAKKAHEKLEPLSTKFVAVSYAKAEELEDQVKTVLSDRGSVKSEPRTNTLIIRDIKKGIEAAVDLISKLDTPIPQVLIEARIVEASTSFARDLGIQWGVDYQTGGNVSTDTFGSSDTSGQTPPSSTDTPAFETRHGATNYAVNLPASGTAGTLGALGFVLGKAGQNPLVLDLRLSAGEQEGKLRTISRPRVVTLDNREAKIEQGESIPFETTSAAGTTTTFVDANLSLTVTPHITPDGSILMKIKASRNSIGTFRTSAGEPSINKKESSTEVLVKDGETTVIGGIVISDKNETENGIPYLRKIPLLGWLFRSKSISDTQTELLIFITPIIVKNRVVG